MHDSLQHFLSLSLKPDIDQSAVATAAELDPAILVTLLASNRAAAAAPGNWQEHIDLPMLQAVAISMGTGVSKRRLEPGIVESAWRRALQRSLLAGALARHLGIDAAEARITALLSDIGEWLTHEACDAAGADFLDKIGCPARVSDAVRYLREPVDRLQGTARLIRLNAAAEHLVAYTDGPDMMGPETLSQLRELTTLSEDDLYDAVGRTSRGFSAVLQQIGVVAPVDQEGPDCLSRMTTSASQGAVFYRALIKGGEDKPFAELISQAGRLLFGFGAVSHFVARDGLLVNGEGDDATEIAVNRAGSGIARCFREQQTVVAEAETTEDIIERQLLGRFGADSLLCVALGDQCGVLVCGIDRMFAEDLEHHATLLDAFADAATDLYQRQSRAGDEVIGLDRLHKRVREITHEVNNPLSIVQNYLGTLSIKLGRESELNREIDAISRELVRVGNIVKKYGRIGQSEAVVLRRVDMNEMISELLAIVKGGRDTLQIATHFDSSIPVVELPADALSQVLVNLFKNAVEALEGIDAPRIEVSTQGAVNVDGKHYLEIVVSDNGRGMSPEQRLNLFSGETSTKGEGRGLGLGIVKNLLAEMSAMIACRENTGGGTSFQVLVPLG